MGDDVVGGIGELVGEIGDEIVDGEISDETVGGIGDAIGAWRFLAEAGARVVDIESRWAMN